MSGWNAAYAAKILYCRDSEVVERTQNTAATTIQYVAINHGCSHIAMAQEFLHCPNVVTRLKQMGSEAMTKAVTCGGFGNAAATDSLLHRFLYNRLMQMMPPL